MKNISIYKKILDNNEKKCIKWQINKFFINFIHNNFGVKRFLEKNWKKVISNKIFHIIWKKKSFDFNFSEIEQKNINFRLEIKTKQIYFEKIFVVIWLEFLGEELSKFNQAKN